MNYDWGDTSLFEKYFSLQIDGLAAELWMGAHTKASSSIDLPENKSLLDAISTYPDFFLGPAVQEKFSKTLPFLFKILSAKKALSIQAHPSLEQAREGFDKENKKGISLTDPARNYRDPNHKPELICAISDFWALRGFREIKRIVEDFRALNLKNCDQLAADLEETKDLKHFFKSLFSLEQSEKDMLLRAAIDHANSQLYLDLAYDLEGPGSSKRYWWIKELSLQFPEDFGVIAPLYLRTIHLKPGDAMFLPAGELHAYLKGIGVELMANSDNVLRGGCTKKHVDVPELLKTLDFKEADFELQTVKFNHAYTSPVNEFKLSPLNSLFPMNDKIQGPAILLNQEGTMHFSSKLKDGVKIPEVFGEKNPSRSSNIEDQVQTISPGQAIFIPYDSILQIVHLPEESYQAFLAEVNL
jgi:mannose-6-phosphate isomerase